MHLTALPGFVVRHRAVVVHHATLAAHDIDRRKRFPVTTVLRSVVDVAAMRADEDQLARVIDEALKGCHFTLRHLRERSEVVDLKDALRIEQAIAGSTLEGRGRAHCSRSSTSRSRRSGTP